LYLLVSSNYSIVDFIGLALVFPSERATRISTQKTNLGLDTQEMSALANFVKAFLSVIYFAATI
jgi:hypothetical protein